MTSNNSNYYHEIAPFYYDTNGTVAAVPIRIDRHLQRRDGDSKILLVRVAEKQQNRHLDTGA